MLTIHWQDQSHSIRRLIVNRGHERFFDNLVTALAEDHHLEVSDDTAVPQPGDFWLGTHPRAGWGNADANSIAWASFLETPLAIQVLQHATPRAQKLDRREWPAFTDPVIPAIVFQAA